jgi:hypothetical protein
VKFDDDHLMDALTSLPPVVADPAREARVRARCHARLAGSASKPARMTLVDRGAVAALLVYLSAVLVESARNL